MKFNDMFLNKKILKIVVHDTELELFFCENIALIFHDDGQKCCEQRFMTTDGDDLSYYHNAEFLGAEVILKTLDSGEEISFLNIKTNKGVFTISCHNDATEVSYSGFDIESYIVRYTDDGKMKFLRDGTILYYDKNDNYLRSEYHFATESSVKAPATDRNIQWFVQRKYHRENGPAIEIVN